MRKKEECLETSALQIQLLDEVIKNFRITLKNGIFYESNHPIYTASLKNFKNTLDQWLKEKKMLQLGISHDNLFLDGSSFVRRNERYTDVANYLHLRGLISLSFQKGVSFDEIKQFFDILRQSRKSIQKNGGIQKQMGSVQHIEVKEIDYRVLLSHPESSTATPEKDVWQSLIKIAQESQKGKLPSSKLQFLMEFLNDANRSAEILNKIYREAVSTLQDESVIENIREAIAQICAYFENHPPQEAQEIKVKLIHVISKLHPDLIQILFEKTQKDDTQFDLVEAITRDLPDATIAEMIESLISNEDTFNENLLKVFDKLAPDADKSGLASLVAEKLFAKRIIDPETLTRLQMAIQEIFKRHPDNSFMSQIYKITVDSVMNRKIDTLVYMARLTPLIHKFIQSMEGEELQKEHIWLLLNILWLESEADEFRKFTEKLLSTIPELVNAKDTERIKEIVEFFVEHTRPEQRRNALLIREIKHGLQKITHRENIESLIAFLPEAGQQELEDIAYILNQAPSESAPLLVNGFIKEKNPATRNKFLFVFSKLKNPILREVLTRFEYEEPHIMKDLFSILQHCDKTKAHLMAKKMLTHKNAQIRWEALDNFSPGTREEEELVFKLYRNESNRSVKRKAASVILRSHNPDLITRLFRNTERLWFKRFILLELIELCGQIRAEEAFPHLKRLFNKKSLWNTKRRDALRSAILNSIARFQNKEATQLIRSALNDKSARIKEISRLILELKES